MIELHDRLTIPQALAAAAQRWPTRPFIAAPANAALARDAGGVELSFGATADAVGRLAARYRDAGYGPGHRVALLLENKPAHLLHKLALTSIGACCVPVNPDYRSGEIAYLVAHARIDLAVALGAQVGRLEAGMAESAHHAPVVDVDAFDAAGPPSPARPAGDEPIGPQTPSSILYTSGTTGRPKGCILSHHYELAAGHWYATRGGAVAFREEGERLYNPLPLHHVNAAVVSFFAMLVGGGCQVQAERFQPSRWWAEVAATRASIVHYLGVIAPMLLNQPVSPLERAHAVRVGVGAGVEPQLHALFEARFGFPLVELWGMTETVRILIDNGPDRRVGTRAFGRAVDGLEVRVVDDADRDVADGQPGEMLVRHSAATPRRSAFSGYLDDDAATEAAWRGGWFHTGDTVTRAPDGMLHFVDRKKHIIRRSGENIAAAEVEALLQSHAKVAQVAVLAVPDEVREEEVLACIVPGDGIVADAALARELFDWCHRRLAYYKAPGWIRFMDALPTTGTQKIQKHQILPPGVDPRGLPGMTDLRALKRRD